MKKNNFEIGLFALNSESGIAMTKSKKRWAAKWDDIYRVVKYCDKNNYDFIFSVQRWLGFGGKTDPAGLTYESANFCSALSSITKKIKLIVTMHTSIIHPTHAARIMATIDNASSGRSCLNIVCGWNKKEFQMFNSSFESIQNGYEQGREWLKIYKNILLGKKVSLKGKFFSVKKAQSKPVLFNKKKPNILSAAFSKTGREFAIKNCGTLVTMFSNIDALKSQITSIKKKSKKIKVYGLCHVVCKKSDKIANIYYNDFAYKKADTTAIKNFMKIISQNPKNIYLKKLQMQAFRKMAGGIGSYPIIGSPKTVIDEINNIKKAGLDGLVISFLDYNNELRYFTRNVLNVIKKK